MFDTFISYRRVGGSNIAARIYDYLKLKGFKPFFDITGMSSGRFDEQLKRNLISSVNYILLLSKGALDRCQEDGDWVYKEIVTALEYNLNIVVLKEEGFTYPDNLRSELEVIKMFQAIEYTNQTLSARMEIVNSMLQRRKENIESPIYDSYSKKKFRISDEYMSFYEDEEDGRIVMRRAPVILKSYMGHIRGKTWFGTSQAWSIRARMYGRKRLVGTYFAKSNIDDGIGNFFLNVKDENTLEGFWSGYDNVNNTITTGKYIFKRKYRGYSIRKATVKDFGSVIKISDAQLGEDYLTKDRLDRILDKNSTDEMLVAVQNATNTVIAFCLYSTISYSDAEKIGREYKFRNLIYADRIGYVATVATKNGFKGLGIATALIEKSIELLREQGANCFISTAWKHAGIINIGSVLENIGFKKEIELPKYWYESSIKEGFMCPQCGNPCTCSCVIYTMI